MSVKDQLYKALVLKNITQSDLHRMTGISKSAISSYLSGKCVPSDLQRRKILEALELPSDYFDEKEEPEVFRMPEKIPRITPLQAAKVMGVSARTVENGLKNKAFPWGYAIKNPDGKYTYWINAMKFAQIEMGGIC
ncbi:MAG: helix-turn-helix transcriptional regulator [Blautia sp.]|nr:helix-turn-helix transcriptional regulator [Blautia sp.]